MKFVIFSDIHGNQHAFKEFLKMLVMEDADKVIFCVDIMGYYYGQEEIVCQLQRMNNLLAVRGNHDEFAINISNGLLDKKCIISRYGQSYRYITNNVKSYIESLPNIIEFEIDGVNYAIMHGYPIDYLNGRIYPVDDITEQLINGYKKYNVVFCGHTHFRMDRTSGKTRIINPGSLGQQRDGKGFCYAVYNTVSGNLKYKEVNCKLKLNRNIIKKHYQ